ncbi:MAG TPA: response regulator [Methylomirabilota bacterium]|jgi:CheY-like chemotaxis protein|nr:response regulator [Methylomirabilota bacterium]
MKDRTRVAERRRRRVLLVEDSPDIREVFTILLRADGLDVVATGSGREAVELAARNDFDIVLTDLGLPDLAGDRVIRDVLAAARRRPRVIVVTGYDEPFVSRAREAGADVVFTKPVVWSTLSETLGAAPRLAAA